MSTADLLFAANAAFLGGGAVVLWLRGRRLLAVFMAAAVAIHFTGLIYVINSAEHPDPSGNYSTIYTVFDFLANFGYLAHSAVFLAVCWVLSPPQPNNSFKGTPNGAP